jgi:hypothetical protein
MDGKVRFEGVGPFQLPVAQDASARGHLDKGVTVRHAGAGPLEFVDARSHVPRGQAYRSRPSCRRCCG